MMSSSVRNILVCVLLPVSLALGACGKKPPPLVQLPTAAAPMLVIKNVGVLDVKTGMVTAAQDVVVAGDRIMSVSATGTENPVMLPGAQTLDGNGATLLPGLIDMHGHTGNDSAPSWLGELPDPERNLQSYLYSGVTTVLDPADLSSEAFKRRDKVNSGELPGPKVYAAGPMITAHGGHPVAILENLAPWWIRWYLIPRFTRQVDNAAEARAAVQEVAALGADVIKLSVDSIPGNAPRIVNEAIAAAVDEAKQQKLRAVAHIGSARDAIDAGSAGVALWMHGVYKERIPDEQIATLAGFKIPMVVTLEVFDSYARLGVEPRVPTALEKETVAPEVLEAFNHVPQSAQLEYFRPFVENLRKAKPHWRENLQRLRAAGVTILAGSDCQSGVFPGPGLHRELAQLVAAGMTPAEAIRAATSDAAAFLANGQEADFGSIAAGKRADLLLVQGDPAQDLAALSQIRAVIKGGAVLERRAAY